MEEKKQLHFLVLTFPLQGHINPALHLAKRLALTTGSRITFSTAINAHRLMFPSLSENAINLETKDELINYIPFSDGHDSYLPKDIARFDQYMSDFNKIGSRTVSHIVETLANQGREVSCIIYTLLLPWATDVARDHHIPSALFWIQPASVFAIYYHFYHGYRDLVKSKLHDPSFQVEFPGLRPYKIQDLPSFITTSIDESDIFHCFYVSFGELFQSLDREKIEKSNPLVLINTFAELEPRELYSPTELDMLPVGPLIPLNDETSNNGDVFKQDDKDYIQWLDTKAQKSVVYVSFGSSSHLKKSQLEELLNALESGGRLYLWVVRKDNRDEGVEFENIKHGMVVEWCDQVRVLSHPSIGCFVTHCGWNSTLESLTCGVLMVCVPRLSDQKMNASLIESVWGVGLRAEVGEEGMLEGKEMFRCVDLIMDDSENAVRMRTKAEVWKKKAREVMSEGRSMERNLFAFIERVRVRLLYGNIKVPW
ncbi:hypothetical protein LUZ60_012282 [Juncus effusus]|nr:hypothetical protein LUZ60_012282 [Juncus effusus]